jgi:hypothetical protein
VAAAAVILYIEILRPDESGLKMTSEEAALRRIRDPQKKQIPRRCISRNDIYPSFKMQANYEPRILRTSIITGS